MKSIVLKNGLLAGLIITTVTLITIAICYKQDDFTGNIYLGYGVMLLSFSTIFIGIKNYRDRVNNGIVSFGKAFKIGFFITLVATAIYVVVWLITYHFFIPDYLDRYIANATKAAKAAGATAAELESEAKEMEVYKTMYKNPLMVALMTIAEILPVGLIVTLIASLVLKRTQRGDGLVNEHFAV